MKLQRSAYLWIIRRWSMQGSTYHPSDRVLAESCIEVLKVIEPFKRDYPNASKAFWVEVCDVRYPCRSSNSPSDETLSNTLIGLLGDVATTPLDDLFRTQLREIHEALHSAADTMLRQEGVQVLTDQRSHEPIFDTRLGRPLLRVVVSH